MRGPHRGAYPKDVTDHSYRVLRQLVELVPDAILIGDWGTWVRRQGLPSHDIDLIVDHASKEAVLAIADEHSQSTHLGGSKWRAELDGRRGEDGISRNAIHVDLYVPHQSRLGQRLQLVVEELDQFTERIDGWRVLDVEAHAATKLAALLDRPESLLGEKDRHEVFQILDDLDPERLGQRLAQASKLSIDELLNAVSEAFDYLKDLDEVRRSQRAAIDAIVARTGGFARRWRENGLVELEAGGSMVPIDAMPASSVSTNDDDRRAVQCRWITADGTQCEMRLRPGSKCPHHPWRAP